ncbi:hypothetical protein CCACVL1_00904 [Corchorus capsularis]|uniref:Uncharacterized protein n=1 Tax=Corchorus capsularis TaxID=210143 RepID=A0A1R3KU05_COCAP|nr:hypothetical protein CCACVL1_00904 [Corchorus capsularis]
MSPLEKHQSLESLTLQYLAEVWPPVEQRDLEAAMAAMELPVAIALWIMTFRPGLAQKSELTIALLGDHFSPIKASGCFHCHFYSATLSCMCDSWLEAMNQEGGFEVQDFRFIKIRGRSAELLPISPESRPSWRSGHSILRSSTVSQY